MKTCQNCGWSQELCGERDCHFSEPKTAENGECSGWEPDLKTYKKAWEIAYFGTYAVVQNRMDNAMSKAIEGG